MGASWQTLPPMLRELARLHEQGYLQELYLNADATFDVEVEGFKRLGAVCVASLKILKLEVLGALVFDIVLLAEHS